MKHLRISLFLAYAYLGIWVFAGLFSNYISSDKPYFIETDNGIEFPIFNSDYERDFKSIDNSVNIIWPLIPFSPTDLDIENTGYKSPGAIQIKNAGRFTHFLGTDHLGRDIAAGLLSGAKVSLKIVFYSLFLSSLFGIFLGVISGFFGDSGLKVKMGLFIFLISIILILLFHALGDSEIISISFFIWILILTSIYFALNKVAALKFNKELRIPLDLTLSRFLEIFDSIPKILLLIAIFAGFTPTIERVILLIALISWPGITKIVRAETLIEKNKNYIEAGRALGFRNRRLIFIHILPNIIAPIIVLLTFNAGSIILIESSLSFLGLGMPPDVLTWGRMLAMAKNHLSSWWLVFFPGFFIFATVFSLNTIGRHLGSKFQYKKRQQLLI